MALLGRCRVQPKMSMCVDFKLPAEQPPAPSPNRAAGRRRRPAAGTRRLPPAPRPRPHDGASAVPAHGRPAAASRDAASAAAAQNRAAAGRERPTGDTRTMSEAVRGARR